MGNLAPASSPSFVADRVLSTCCAADGQQSMHSRQSDLHLGLLTRALASPCQWSAVTADNSDGKASVQLGAGGIAIKVWGHPATGLGSLLPGLLPKLQGRAPEAICK